ncbi:hypothetical protein PbB2_01562 [Candidatus Phycosocius bacilliformis]|uniref:Fatty acid hydroxylase domain-containing protein n=1 Tax=Candidatus Phycosocius bacilliformis TaxID=1445552 RepID=A0A2P2EA05_9PROT|nr:sterol desaturase family protein [Candidatus Phycosocius bacilliformis]GBF57892.1 hypothetical protein PbB2_01562 [Candidatus Phycosocius bacilliformis]
MVNDILNLPIVHAGMWLLICACLFGFLQSLFPLDTTRRPLRRDIWMDIGYWMLGPMFYGTLSTMLIAGGFLVLFGGNMEAAVAWSKAGAPWLADWPLWLQALGVLIVTDISLYWTHRLFHSNALWRIHAIHHAPETLDWLHAVRFHPINTVFHSIFANAVALWMGFPPAAIAVLVPFNVLYSAMVHANLNWTFGPLRHVFASPVFHRWHHTGADEGGSKNFAATFSCLDHLFGTFYMPPDQKPTNLGLTDRDMPASLIGQWLYPLMSAREADDKSDASASRTAQ